MENQDIISFKSHIDEAYKISIVYDEYEGYNELVSIMKNIGESIAIINLETKHIVIDGEEMKDLGFDHLLAIQAHEICHSVLEHGGGFSETDEIEADVCAINLLDTMGYTNASNILSERLLKFRGLIYSQETLIDSIGPDKMEFFNQYLKKIRKNQ